MPSSSTHGGRYEDHAVAHMADEDEHLPRQEEDDAFIDDEGVERDPYAEEDDAEARLAEDERLAAAPQAIEEDDDIKKLMESGKGGRRKKQDLSASEKALFVEEFQAKLERAAADDAEANIRGEPAIYKLRVLPDLVKTLRIKSLQKEFLDRGVFTILKNWLEPLPDWSLPNIKIRTAVLELLTELPIDVANNPERRRQLKESGLGKVVMFLAKLGKEETVRNRKLASDLVDTWTRNIFEKSTHFRDLREYEAERPRKRPHEASPSQEVKRSEGGAGPSRRDDLDDVDELVRDSMQAPLEKRRVTRVPQASAMNYSVRPESRIREDAAAAGVKDSNSPHQALQRRMQKMKGVTKGRIARAEKVSVEGRGLVKYL